MKPRYLLKGKPCMKMGITFHVTHSHIEQAIAQLIMEKDRITISSVDSTLRMRFREAGYHYGEEDDTDGCLDDAVTISREMFPEFYKFRKEEK